LLAATAGGARFFWKTPIARINSNLGPVAYREYSIAGKRSFWIRSMEWPEVVNFCLTRASRIQLTGQGKSGSNTVSSLMLGVGLIAWAEVIVAAIALFGVQRMQQMRFHNCRNLDPKVLFQRLNLAISAWAALWMSNCFCSKASFDACLKSAIARWLSPNCT
jgi:hypothetical protein